MTPQPIPTQAFVLIQFRPKSKEYTILLPDGAHPTSGGDFVILATGPDVPQNPPLTPGTKVLLRQDMPAIHGIDEKQNIGMIHSEWIMAVVPNEIAEDATLPLPFEKEPCISDATLEALRHG